MTTPDLRTAEWTTALVDPRARSLLLTLHGYCRTSACSAREVTVRIKDSDATLLARLRTHTLRCPVCHEPLTCHSVLTADQQHRDDDREARCSVNRQRYERDHGACVPASVFLDDRLPDAERSTHGDS
jgi:hypothetical protein